MATAKGPVGPNVLKIHNRQARALRYVCGPFVFDYAEAEGLFRDRASGAEIIHAAGEGWAIRGAQVLQPGGWPFADWAVAHVFNCATGRTTEGVK